MIKKILILSCLLMAIPVHASTIPLDAKLDYNQGIDFYKLGMYERAIESFRAAIRSYPDYIDAYYNLGTILEYLKQYSEAIVVYKQVYARNPNDYEVIYKLANLSIRQEDYASASRYINSIPSSSSFYIKAQDLAQKIKNETQLPIQKNNAPSNIANYSGIYENIQSPTGITTDLAGNVYVAMFSDNSIMKITPEGARKVFLKSNMINGPISLASDSIGNIYVSNYNSNNVLKITPQGQVSVLIDKLDKPYGLHIDNNMLFVTCQGSHSVYRKKL